MNQISELLEALHFRNKISSVQYTLVLLLFFWIRLLFRSTQPPDSFLPLLFCGTEWGVSDHLLSKYIGSLHQFFTNLCPSTQISSLWVDSFKSSLTLNLWDWKHQKLQIPRRKAPTSVWCVRKVIIDRFGKTLFWVSQVQASSIRLRRLVSYCLTELHFVLQ